MPSSRRRHDDATPVYSTEGGRVRQPVAAPAAAARSDGIVRVSRTSAGRKGKTVTLATGLPAADADRVLKELKRLCGAGGALKDGVVEIQGDHRDAVQSHLEKVYRVKRAGG
ncbi:MAG: stress response translation initiation inhibitor YciH [Thermoleophilia bacterium]|nr:stress response translation initiation inhibitor YciH [Thermoleophilia bacterium]